MTGPVMRSMRDKRRGAGGMEYAVMIGLVAVVVIVALTRLGGGISSLFAFSANRLDIAANSGGVSSGGTETSTTPNCSLAAQSRTTAGSYTVTIPNGCTQATVSLWGGGGGASYVNVCLQKGGGAGYAKSTLAVSGGQVLTVTIGGGGTNAASSGGATTGGGTSSIVRGGVTLMTATGGNGSSADCNGPGRGAPGSGSLGSGVTGTVAAGEFYGYGTDADYHTPLPGGAYIGSYSTYSSTVIDPAWAAPIGRGGCAPGWTGGSCNEPPGAGAALFQ